MGGETIAQCLLPPSVIRKRGEKTEEETQWTVSKIKKLRQTVSENDNSTRLYKLHTITVHLRVGPKRCVAEPTVHDVLEVRGSSYSRVRHTQTVWSVSTSNLLIDWETLNGM